MFVLTNIEARSLNNFRCRILFYPYLSGMQISCAIFYCNLWPVWHYHYFPLVS